MYTAMLAGSKSLKATVIASMLMAVLAKLKRADFDKILSHYHIGSYKVHRYLPYDLKNSVYFLRTNKGRFVLKIFGNQRLSFSTFQARLAEYLASRGIPVPQLSRPCPEKAF